MAPLQTPIWKHPGKVKIEPLSNLSRCARAVTKLNLGEYESALRDLDAALELDPDNAGALHSRGVARGNLGRPADAIEDFDRSLRLDPGNLEALAARGAAHDNLGQYDRAIEDFSRVIVIDPDDSRVRFARGVARMRLGANEEAIEDFSAILKVNPDEIGALYARAVARQWLGRDDEANEHFERYFELAPDEADADSGGVIQLAADVQRDDWLDRQALLKLRAGGWEIDIERRVDFTQAMNHMEERRGYAVTHNCRLSANPERQANWRIGRRWKSSMAKS